MIPTEKLTIETPEQISLEFHLAGAGSRFLAIAFDTLLQVAVFLLLALAGLIFAPGLARFWQSAWKWSVAIFGLVFFTLYWGYFAIFEALWNGQTPGKRQAGIRVIKDSGRPITAFEAVTRNLMRAVDSLPGIYAVGLVTMFFSSRNCRLGDLVAGTVVVHEAVEEKIQPTWNRLGLSVSLDRQEPKAASSLDLGALTSRDAEVIEAFLHRKLDLPLEVRQATAQKLAAGITRKLGPQDVSLAKDKPEDFLELVMVQLRDTARFRK